MTERGKRPRRIWNEEEKQALADLFGEGWKLEAIAAQLTEDFGFTVTVDAVAGRVSRMGLREPE